MLWLDRLYGKLLWLMVINFGLVSLVEVFSRSFSVELLLQSDDEGVVDEEDEAEETGPDDEDT
jgi:hypothetical protein